MKLSLHLLSLNNLNNGAGRKLSVPFGFFEECIRVWEGGSKDEDVRDVMLWGLSQLTGIKDLDEFVGWEALYMSIISLIENIGDAEDNTPVRPDAPTLYMSLFDMSASVCSMYHMTPFELRREPAEEVITLFNRIMDKGKRAKKENSKETGYISQEERILKDGTKEIRRKVFADNF